MIYLARVEQFLVQGTVESVPPERSRGTMPSEVEAGLAWVKRFSASLELIPRLRSGGAVWNRATHLQAPFAALAFITSLALASPATAAVFIDFDGVTTGAFVDSYYNAGTDSAGAGGHKFEVDFSGFITTSGFGETSQPNLAYNQDPVATINFARGYSYTRFSYGAFADGVVTVFSEVNGGGVALSAHSLITNNPYRFDVRQFAFGGTARSLVFSGGATTLGIDDLLLTTAIPSIPEPAAWALMLTGFVVAGGAMRRTPQRINHKYRLTKPN
jgi:hypothetical protein